MTGLRRLAIDIGPLRASPPFRRLWLGSGLSQMGGQMTQYAVLLQVFLLTRSTLMVGVVGGVIAVPSVVVGVLGGAVVDALDRRRTVLVCTSVQAGLSATLAAQAFAHLDRVWLLYVLVAAQAAVGGINAPARRTFMPTLLGSDRLAAGAALQGLAGYTSMTAGPAVAGVLTAAVGLRACYLVDAASFAAALYAVARLPRLPQARPTRRGPRAVADGLAFVGRHRPVLGALLSDASSTFLGLPVALFPAVDSARWGGHPVTLGLLTTALAAGGVAGALLSGPVSRVERQGLGQLVAGAVWGAGLLGFGLAGAFWLAAVALAVAGAADATAVTFRTAIVQGATPDELRGRVSAAEFAVGAGVPQLGNLRAGAVASLSSPGVAAVTGGVTTMAGVVAVALCVPALAAFRRRRVMPSAGGTRLEAELPG